MKMMKSGQISNPFLKDCVTLQFITHNSSIVFVPFRARSDLPSICGPQAVSLVCIPLFPFFFSWTLHYTFEKGLPLRSNFSYLNYNLRYFKICMYLA